MVVLVTVLVVALPIQAGHESLFLPSYYPQEIRVESVDPAAATGLLQRAAIHAFIGDDPFAGRAVPSTVTSVESLGSFLVVTLNTTSRRLSDRERRCTLAKAITTILARDQARYVFHPYPVTPYHMDYLEHADLAQLSKQGVLNHPVNGQERSSFDFTVSAQGPLAEDLVKAKWPLGATRWDARVETVDVAELLTAHSTNVDGWVGPPWLKEGWFNAYLLLADRVTDRRVKTEVDQVYHRLVTGDYREVEEKVMLARTLVSQLRAGCERVVVGYTLRPAYFNADYSQGIENVAYDSHYSVNSPIFVRTAKLKDFLWNGQLRIGVAGKAAAAWNPISGFGDAFGRLVWSALGDSALLPEPYSAKWMPNRVTFRLGQDTSWLGSLRRVLAGAREGVQVPSDAIIPQTGGGLFDTVGGEKWARAKVEYRVLESTFHDGTQMTVADVLYPYIVAYRWSDGNALDNQTIVDRSIARATVLMRQYLVGIKVLRTETVVKNLGGDLQLRYDVPVIEVYLNYSSADPQAVAAIAPPWSTVPWSLMVLMEEAVRRGAGAFSADEAARRGVPWLDLVRAQRTKETVARILDEFARQGYIPEALRPWVTREEAKHRWRALQEFYRNQGHFLVTNGPYRLRRWTDHSAVLDAFRNPSYPLGVGSFDRFARPRRAYVTRLSLEGTRLEVQADVERVIKFERSYKIVRERLGSNTSGAIDQVNPLCRYLVVRDDGRVVKVATATYGNDGVYAAELRGARDTGRFTVIVGMYLNENMVTPDVKLIRN